MMTKSKDRESSTFHKSIEVADFYEASYIAYALSNRFSFYSDITRLWKDTELPAYIALLQRTSFFDKHEAQVNFKEHLTCFENELLNTAPLRWIYSRPTDAYFFLQNNLRNNLAQHQVLFKLYKSIEKNCFWSHLLLKDLLEEKKERKLKSRNQIVKAIASPEYYHQEKNGLKRVWKRNSAHLKTYKKELFLSKKRNHSKRNMISFSQKNKSSDLTRYPKSSEFTWNHLCQLNGDLSYHGLTLTSFNQAFELLDENRELLDYLASYLLRLEILRPRATLEFVSRFVWTSNPLKTKKGIEKTRLKQKNLNRSVLKHVHDKKKIKKIIKRKWGIHSMMMISSFVTFTPKEILKQERKD